MGFFPSDLPVKILCVIMTSLMRVSTVQIFRHHWSIILKGPIHRCVRVKNKSFRPVSRDNLQALRPRFNSISWTRLDTRLSTWLCPLHRGQATCWHSSCGREADKHVFPSAGSLNYGIPVIHIKNDFLIRLLKNLCIFADWWNNSNVFQSNTKYNALS